MLVATLLAIALATVPSAHADGNAAAPVPYAPTFRHYAVIDGLPSDAVYTLAQDHAGYVWIGTRDGLARFDAQDFRIFRHDPADLDSIGANDVSALLIDRQGRLWAGGEDNGLNLHRPDGSGFAHWRHDARRAGSLAGNDVMSLAQDADGSIWVGVYAGGVNRLLPDGKSFVHVRHRDDDDASLVSDNVMALAASADGGLWIGTDAGLQHRDRQGLLQRIALPGTNGTVSVWQLNVDGDGVDAATDAGLFHIDGHGGAQRIGAATTAYASLHGAQGEWWITRQNGIDLLAPGAAPRHYAPHAGVTGSLPGLVSPGLLRDHEGGIWIALLDGGVAYLPPHWNAFDAWRHIPDDDASLDDDRLRALIETNDGMLIAGGAQGVLARIDPRAHGIQSLTKTIGLDDSSISALAQDAQGRLWVGHRHGLRLLDATGIHDVGVGAPGLHLGVRALLAARDGTIYFAGADSGVIRIDPRTLAFTATHPAAANDAALQVRQLREADDGSIWSAGPAGLARMQPGTNVFHFVPGVQRGIVDAFAFGHGNDLWVARSDRLLRYTLRGGVSRLRETIDAARGWPAVEAGDLETGADGRVWASTLRGLVAYDPATRKVRVYTGADGLGNPELASGSLLRGADGTLYAASLGGVMAIHPSALVTGPPAPEIALSKLSVRRDGRMLDLDPRATAALRWNDRELTATAHALSFVDPKRNHYRFMLAGFDPDWVDTGTRDTREFSSLRAGTYRLRVDAANGDGPWSAASPPVTIRIAAPPWATPWAWAAYALATLLLLAFAASLMRRHLEQRHRFDLIAQRQQLAEQANAAKTHFLASMAHEIRTPMTGVLGMTELLLGTQLDARQRGYASDLRRSGALLLRQVNDALDLARIEAGKLELVEAAFDPRALLHEVEALERALAEQKSLTLDVDIAVDAPCALRGDALRVQQVLLNLAHNALKFTQVGGVRLQLRRGREGVLFSVGDDGPGMTADECARLFRRFEQTESGRRHSGSGLGLAISRELVELMGGRIEVRSQPGCGSTFDVHLPLPECTEFASGREDTAATACHAGDTHEAARPLRVLVVEDDPVAAAVACGLLSAQDHVAVHASHALAALTELESARDGFDAILLDLDLSGLDGCSLSRLLRARGTRLPIIGITAGSAGDEERRACAAGMDAFLRKPVVPEHLREALARLSRRIA